MAWKSLYRPRAVISVLQISFLSGRIQAAQGEIWLVAC